MSVQKIRKEVKHQSFIEAATRIFAQKGFQAMNVIDIVKAANSGQGTFYYHFADKQAIFDEIMICFIDGLTESLSGIENSGDGTLTLASRDLSIRNARAIAAVFARNIHLAKLFFNESRYLSGKGMERVALFYSLLFRQIESGIEQGKREGVIRENADPVITAQCMVGAIERVIYEAVSSGPPSPETLDYLAAQIVDFQMKGILKSTV